MIRIEFEEPRLSRCDCCGQEVVSLTRFVFLHEDAFAVYLINFTRGHKPKFAHGIVAIGGWGLEVVENRRAFPFQIRTNETNYQVGMVDAEESPWHKADIFGKILNRDESLKHDWIKDVFQITDHIVTEDQMVIDFFTKADI